MCWEFTWTHAQKSLPVTRHCDSLTVNESCTDAVTRTLLTFTTLPSLSWVWSSTVWAGPGELPKRTCGWSFNCSKTFSQLNSSRLSEGTLLTFTVSIPEFNFGLIRYVDKTFKQTSQIIPQKERESPHYHSVLVSQLFKILATVIDTVNQYHRQLCMCLFSHICYLNWPFVYYVQ